MTRFPRPRLAVTRPPTHALQHLAEVREVMLENRRLGRWAAVISLAFVLAGRGTSDTWLTWLGASVAVVAGCFLTLWRTDRTRWQSIVDTL